jgi:galactonate dehydratase
VVTPVLEVVDGHLPVPDAPGLGVDLVLDEIAKYPSRRNVQDLPPDDGRAYEHGTVDESVYFQTRLRRRARLRRPPTAQE